MICEAFLNKSGVEVIPNAVTLTIKYFLRLVENPEEYIKVFTSNLCKSFQEDSTLKDDHILKWEEILKKFGFKIYS